MPEDAAKLKREWTCLWRPFLFLLIFRSTMQIGRIAEVPGAFNIWRYKTRSSPPSSMHSGNCAAKDRVRFPCGRAKLPGPRFLVAGHAGMLLSHDRVCRRSHTGSATQRARITRGLGVNNRSLCCAVETRVVAGMFELHLALYLLLA